MWFQKLKYRIERETESLPLQSLPSALTDHVTKLPYLDGVETRSPNS